ncbi:potassium channel family protein [Chloroflexota bacterium]
MMRNTTKHLRLLIALPIAVLLIGTVGFMILEKLPFMEALYFTTVTISTVGYGDIHPTTTSGKVFGIVLILIGIGIFLTVVTNVAEILVQRGREKIREQRLHMIIGVFFTEVGNQLLHLFAEFDPHIEVIRKEFMDEMNRGDIDFARLRSNLQNYEFAIDSEIMELETLRNFLKERGDLLLRQIENPDLLEHESFTELLWAVVHLRDELMSRKSLKGLPETDLTHLANDAKRAYSHLARQWSDYLQHLKISYPYLFSLALRTNPFVKNPSAIVQ